MQAAGFLGGEHLGLRFIGDDRQPGRSAYYCGPDRWVVEGICAAPSGRAMHWRLELGQECNQEPW